MIAVTNNKLVNCKLKLMLLYILNLSDIVFTQILLSTGQGYEANPLMAKLTHDPLLAISFKSIGVGLLLMGLYWVFGKLNSRNLRKSEIVVNVLIGLYIVVNCMHIYNCSVIF